jgi:restriction system protein
VAKERQAEFVKWMQPILVALRQLGGSGSPKEVSDLIAVNEKISDKKLEEVMKSGGSKFHNQVAWARQYLVWEGLLDSSKKGTWTLTEKGYNTNLSYEHSRQVFLKWVAVFAEARKNKTKQDVLEELTQAELLEPEKADITYNPSLLEILQKVTPEGFERICQILLRESGFEKVTVTGKSGDGGIDGIGILQINSFVSFNVLFQCKRYKGGVTPSQVRDFRGAMQGRAEKGIIITTGYFTQEAIREANREGVPPIEIVDGDKLVSLFEKVELGLKPKKVFEVDLNFFQPFLPK